MKKIILILAVSIFAATSLSAKGECRSDREKLCSSVKKGDHKAMWQCMKEHETELSDACKNKISQVREKNREVKKACKADYKQFCKDKKAGKGHIIHCLKKNEAQLSESCKNALSQPVKVD
ncbi:MAG TPA: cysteine rich repeat-containing protein [Turneriella sp.]|nr:cysteine rich repeat-containing protein [Turneriella sp.]